MSSAPLKNLSFVVPTLVLPLDQLCPTRGPVEGFVWPSLHFCYSKSILHTDNLSWFW